MVLKLMLASLCMLLLGPPAFGGRYVLRRDSAAGNGTKTIDVNLAADGRKWLDFVLPRRRNRRRDRRRRDRRRVSSTDRRGEDCWKYAYCKDNLDVNTGCPDCGQHPVLTGKYMFCCRGKFGWGQKTYKKGHGCWGSDDSNENNHTCSTPYCPDMNGIWTRTNSGQATRHIEIQTFGCWLKYDVGNWDATANDGAGGYTTGTPDLTWLRVMGGYVWGPWEYDKGDFDGSGATKVVWSTGPKWHRGASLYHCTVVLYEHSLFKGKESKTFDVGDYNVDAMKSKNTNNDYVTSVKVGPGCKVYLYEHGEFFGKNVVLGAGSHSSLAGAGFPNDALSSLKVRKA